MDELQRIAADERGKALGQTWFKEVRDFYNLASLNVKVPSFRPVVNIPQLQVLSIRESSDLSDISPRVYVADPITGRRDEAREKAFQQQWRDSAISYHTLFAILWAQLSSIGWLQLGYDPFAASGLGELWCRHRDPETVYVSPGATSDEDWLYVMLEDRYYPEQIAYCYPETGRELRSPPYTTGQSQDKSISGYGFTLPEGPMSSTSLLRTEQYRGDGRLSLRTLFIHDATIEIVRDAAGSDAGKQLSSIYKRAYPNGRVVVTAGYRVLADGNNPTPGRMFPVVPIYGMPPLSGFYPPAPTKYSKDLQELSGRMFSQTFENAVRVNNMVWFIDENTGIANEAFGGLPGEVVTISAMSRIPEMRAPQPFPEHMIKLPLLLLDIQKDLQGFTPSREGDPGAGNISADLFESSIFQSKDLTRMRARLLAHAIQKVAILLYRLMATHYIQGRNFFRVDENFEVINWPPLADDTDRMSVMVDESTLMPVSQAAMRRLAPMLRQLGAIDVKSLLEAVGWPSAADAAAKVDREQVLAALARIRRR